MRKLTLIAALLGATYFANAQVGIGTADPATSAELDIVAKLGDKGILIPRVVLETETKFGPITGAQVESLLVYNTATTVDPAATMPNGFYYWDGAKWNRLIGKEEFTSKVEEIGGDLTDIKNVINFILPSNPGNDNQNPPSHTTIVYDNTTGDLYEVIYDATKNEYITKKIDLLKMIQGKETNTILREIKDANGKTTGFLYFNEKTIVTAIGDETDPLKIEEILGKLDENTPGVVVVDVTGIVVNNFKEILEAPTTITIVNKAGDTLEFKTVEEYLQYISQSVEGNVIYKNISTDVNNPNWVFQYYDETTGGYITINISDLVGEAETKTNILRTVSLGDGTLEGYEAVGAPVEADVKKGEIFYMYNNEDKNDQFINMTADIISSIENNEDVKNAITNVLNQGGNVYFGDHDGDAATDEVFYQIIVDASGNETKVPIELPASFLLDIINKYKTVIKNALGDHIDNSTSIVNTGNTYNGKIVFLAKAKTTVGKIDGGINYPSPLTTGTEFDLSQIAGLTHIEDVLTISILKDGKIVASSVADLVVTNANKLEFAIGTGAFYTALPYGEYEVVVEFTGNLAPIAPIVPQP